MKPHSFVAILLLLLLSCLVAIELGPTDNKLQLGSTEFTGADNVTKCRVCQIDCWLDVPQGTWVNKKTCTKRFFNYGCSVQFYCLSPNDYNFYEKVVIAGLCANNKCKFNPEVNSQNKLEHLFSYNRDTTDDFVQRSAYTANAIVKYIQASASEKVMTSFIRPRLMAYIHPGPAALLRLKQSFDILEQYEAAKPNDKDLVVKRYVEQYKEMLPEWFKQSYHIIDTNDEIQSILTDKALIHSDSSLIHNSDLFFFRRSNELLQHYAMRWWSLKNSNYATLINQVVNDIETIANEVNEGYYTRRVKEATYEKDQMMKLLESTRQQAKNLKKNVAAVVSEVTQLNKDDVPIYSGKENNWKTRSKMLYVDVITNLEKKGQEYLYFTTIAGRYMHWRVRGVSSIYPNRKGFRVYVVFDDGEPIKLETAKAQHWEIHWIAVPKTNLQTLSIGYDGLGKWSPVFNNVITTQINTKLLGEQYIFTSLQGAGLHFTATGTNAITRLHKDFQFNVTVMGATKANPITFRTAEKHDWRINYLAIRTDDKRFLVGSSINWQVCRNCHQSKGIEVYVDLTSFNLKKPPVVLTNLEGTDLQAYTLGSTSIYDLTKNGFKVIIRFNKRVRQNGGKDDVKNLPAVTPKLARDNSWKLNWLIVRADDK